MVAMLSARKTTHKSTTAGETTSVGVAGGDATPNDEWTIGMRVEAKDANGTWYPAKVVGVADDRQTALVHFTRWSARFDEWVRVDTLRVKPPPTPPSARPDEYAVGEQVLARWTDGRRYHATVHHVFDDQKSALVVFDDNYRKKVKLSSISKLSTVLDSQSTATSAASTSTTTTTAITSATTSSTTTSTATTSSATSGESSFKCDACDKTFRKYELLVQHLKHYHTNKSETTTSSTNTTTTTTTTSTTTTTTAETCKRQSTTTSDETKAKRKKNNSFNKRVFKSTPSLVWSATQMAERHENAEVPELVHCCEEREESGLMIQCDCCLTWQHAVHVGFDVDNDDEYVCASCRRPPFGRPDAVAMHALNAFLKSGKRLKSDFFVTTDDDDVDSDRNANACKQLFALLDSLLNVRDVLHVRPNDESAAHALAAIERAVEELEQKEVGERLDKRHVQLSLEQLFNDLKVARKICENQ